MTSRAEYAISLADESQWDDSLRQYPEYTVFHTLPWLKSLSAAYGLRIVLTQAELDGRCVAVWPYLVLRKGPFRVVGSPLPGWSTAYMGPLVRNNVGVQEVIAAFLRHRLFRRYAYFACRTLIGSNPIDLSDFGFRLISTFETYLLDLSLPEEALWNNLKSQCRGKIRQAKKSGLEIKEERSDQFLEDYWQMTIETYAKSNLAPPHSRQLVEEMWRQLHPAGLMHVLSVFHEQERISTFIFLLDDHTMYYWGGCSFLRHRQLPAHNLLHWEAITEARKRGLKRYDFISTIGGPGQFKKSFGPKAIDMARHWERSSSRLTAILKNSYERFLRKRRRLSS